MKRLFSALLVISMICSLVGCGAPVKEKVEDLEIQENKNIIAAGNVEWGMTEQEIIDMEGEPSYYVENLTLRYENISWLGETFEAAYFITGIAEPTPGLVFYNISTDLQTDYSSYIARYYTLQEKMIEKYGAPTDEVENGTIYSDDQISVDENAYITTWEPDNITITLNLSEWKSEYEGKPIHTRPFRVIFSNPEHRR